MFTNNLWQRNCVHKVDGLKQTHLSFWREVPRIVGALMQGNEV